MLTLRTRNISITNAPQDGGVHVLRISMDPARPHGLARTEGFLWRGGEVPEGYKYYLQLDEDEICESPGGRPVIILPSELSYLGHGDVVVLNFSAPSFDVIYRRNSKHNSFLVTERCSHRCLMCSQPPRNVQDGYLVDDILRAIPLIDPQTEEIGFTGGEPTLLGERLLQCFRACKNYLPSTSVHLLTHGRRFADEQFTRAYADVAHHDLMAGIPIYSDVSTIHDYVVQSDGAFDETIRGILNLKRHRQRVEIRVVIHRQTYSRLPQLAEFIARNLMFVDHVALMGLEITGFTRANLAELWIDPVEYQRELYRAVTTLHAYGMNVSVYNHQLCVTDQRIWPFARRSISDWKNEFMPECEGCNLQGMCAGFFSSAKHRYSDHIAPIYDVGAAESGPLPEEQRLLAPSAWSVA